MKIIISLIFLFSLALTSNAQDENGLINTKALLKSNYDFSSDKDPSVRKLKKIKENGSREETLEYAIYLYNILFSESNEKQEFSDKTMGKLGEIIKEYILPEGLEGNIKAVSFLSGNELIKSSYALELVSKNKTNTPALKFIKYQLNLKIRADEKLEDLRGVNRYELSRDTLLLNYFSEFKKSDLIKLRDSIVNKKQEITNIKKNSTTIKSIEFSDFSLSFGIYNQAFIRPIAFNGKLLSIDASAFLEVLYHAIDQVLINQNPISLGQILFDYLNHRVDKKMTFDYYNPKSQFFLNDKKMSPIIFSLLSGVLDYNTENLNLKCYYLNRAAETGDSGAYSNLAYLYQTLYYNTNENKFNDSCIKYIEKAGDYAADLKAIKIFNGEGYIQNKEKGIRLLMYRKSQGSDVAIKLLETFPKEIFPDIFTGFYSDQHPNVKYPWDFKLLCSNNCGNYTYPDKIIFGREYEKNYNGGIFIKKTVPYYNDKYGNPTINICDNDFKQTFNILKFGREWYHLMCSNQCQLANENKVKQNDNQVANERFQFNNEVVKCAACSKKLKRKDMLMVAECPCIDENGRSTHLTLTDAYDLIGDSAPRVCSSACQINYCKFLCNQKGYSSNLK